MNWIEHARLSFKYEFMRSLKENGKLRTSLITLVTLLIGTFIWLILFGILIYIVQV